MSAADVPDLQVLAAPEPGDAYAAAMLPTGMFGASVCLCLRCGALVGNRQLHDGWHAAPEPGDRGTA